MTSSAELYSPSGSGSSCPVMQFRQDGQDGVVAPRSTVRRVSSSEIRISCIFSPGRMPVTSDLDRAVPDEAAATSVDACRRHARDVGLAALRLAQRREDGIHGLVQAEQEARHVRVVTVTGPPLAHLIVEQRDHRTARGQHVAVAHADEARLGASMLARRRCAPGSPWSCPSR